MLYAVDTTQSRFAGRPLVLISTAHVANFLEVVSVVKYLGKDFSGLGIYEARSHHDNPLANCTVARVI